MFWSLTVYFYITLCIMFRNKPYFLADWQMIDRLSSSHCIPFLDNRQLAIFPRQNKSSGGQPFEHCCLFLNYLVVVWGINDLQIKCASHAMLQQISSIFNIRYECVKCMLCYSLTYEHIFNSAWYMQDHFIQCADNIGYNFYIQSQAYL